MRSINGLLLSTVLTAAAVAQMSPESAFMGGPGFAWQAKAGMTMRIDSMDAAPVKGAPFCATVVTEHTQSLADGNRIHTTDSSMLCRDGEGRTRREAGLNLLGASPQASAPKLITITDPVAGVRYLLDTENKIAQKMPMMPEGGPEGPGPAHAQQNREVMIYQRSGGPGPGANVFFNDVVVKKGGPDAPESDANKENLGDQTIEGIHTVGTRVTSTIPAGKMGNEKPITVTSERWYSPELKATVMTKHNDPWSGELKTEFKNVSNGEPEASLFAVPADYKVVDDKDGPIRIRVHAPGPPPAQEQ
jgi:hypothetical protein